MGMRKLLYKLRLVDIRINGQCPFRNSDFCSKSRNAKNLTTGIWLIFRGLNFEHNAEFGRKDCFANGSNRQKLSRDAGSNT